MSQTQKPAGRQCADCGDVYPLRTRRRRCVCGGVFTFYYRRPHVPKLVTRANPPARPLSGVVDPLTTEVLIRPADILEMPAPAGDCDDHAMLAASMLLSRGIEPELVTIAADPAAPQVYSHVYARARLAGERVAMDTSHGEHIGWEAPAAGKRRTWRLQEMRTLGAIDWGALLTKGVDTAGDILTTRYGTRPEGYYETGPGGTVTYRQPQNAGPLQFPGLQATGGYTWVLVGLGLFAVVALLSQGGRH